MFTNYMFFTILEIMEKLIRIRNLIAISDTLDHKYWSKPKSTACPAAQLPCCKTAPIDQVAGRKAYSTLNVGNPLDGRVS